MRSDRKNVVVAGLCSLIAGNSNVQDPLRHWQGSWFNRHATVHWHVKATTSLLHLVNWP